MVFEALDKAYDSLNTLNNKTITKNEQKIFMTKPEIQEKEKKMLLQIMPYINEIIQKTSKEIVLSFPEDRRHIIEEYNNYMKNEIIENNIITLNEDDIAYLSGFKYIERDDSMIKNIQIEKKRKINLMKCLETLQKK